MKLHAKIALLSTFVASIGIVSWKYIEPYVTDKYYVQLSDSGENGTIKIGIDGWIGYYPLCSSEMKRRLNQQGYGLQCIDDNADYRDRFFKLKTGTYDFAVGTVDSFILNAEQYNYPGVILSVIDESKGGDALIARNDRINNLEDLKGDHSFTIAYTPDSPSHHLLKSLASHFDIPILKKPKNHITTEGSDSAYNLLEKGQVDLAALWEPEVSKALASGKFKKLIGTEDTKNLIVDVLIAGHKSLRSDSTAPVLLKAYFQTLKHYQDNPEKLIRDLSSQYKIDQATTKQIIKGVEWANLQDNAEAWFGVSASANASEGIIRSIESTTDILMDSKDFSRNPIPDGDSYRLINSQYINNLYSYFSGSTSTPFSNNRKQAIGFSRLSNKGWSELRDVGSLKLRAISFASGTAALTFEGKQQIDQIMKDLEHYPNFRIEVRGHSGIRGDAKVNLELSQERADTVLRYMNTTYSLSENRARAKGFGSTKPLPKQLGESNRAYGYRLPRVEIALVREVL